MWVTSAEQKGAILCLTPTALTHPESNYTAGPDWAAKLDPISTATDTDAFIFTDLVAKVQRITMIGQAAQHLEQIDSYRKEFDKYKKESDKYFQSFRRIYRRLSSADWADFNPSKWARLEDHVITIWKTFDEQAWQTQVLALKISPPLLQ